MKRKGRRMAIALVAGLLLAVVVLYWPRAFRSAAVDEYQVTVNLPGVEEDVASVRIHGYELYTGQEAFDRFEELLEGARYHATLATLFGKGDVKGIDCSIVFVCGEDTVVLTDRGLLIDERFYRVGYFGYGRERDLVEKMLAVLATA